MEWIFWTSLILLIYIYFGYPLLLWLTRSSAPPPSPAEPSGQGFDVVVASHLEGPRLLEKIREVYDQGKDLGLRRLLVALDGPDTSLPDAATDRLASDFPFVVYPGQTEMPESGRLADRGCAVIEFSKREGKPACLNRLLTRAESEWVIFLDVRQRLDTHCLEALSKHFSNPEVHVVSGNLEWEPAATENATGEGVGIYWAYEKWIRQQESRRGKVPGATGACYALRRSSFSAIPADTLVDDVLIPLQACLDSGQCRFEEQARIFDVPSERAGQETLRKRRTIAGVLQLAVRHPAWNLPGGHPFWFHILSHKTLRLAGPFLLLFLLISNFLLLDSWGYRFPAMGQGVFYLAAFSSPFLAGIPLLGKICSGAHAFVLLNGSCLMAVLDSLTGRFQGGWDRAYAQASETGASESES